MHGQIREQYYVFMEEIGGNFLMKYINEYDLNLQIGVIGQSYE